MKLMGLTGPFSTTKRGARVNCSIELEHKDIDSEDLICAPALAINVTGGFLYLRVLQRWTASNEAQMHEQQQRFEIPECS